MKRILKVHSYIKLAILILSPFFRLKKTPKPTLYMTLLVRNEEDIIEQNLIFHKNMGVDGFIVTDNNSSDNTLKILNKYKEKGWIKEIIIESNDNYDQALWVNRMIKIASQKYKADWIINSDADELWYSPDGNIKKNISDTHSNILSCPLFNVIPENDKSINEWNKVIKTKIDNIEKFELSEYSIFGKLFNKEMHRAKGYIRISVGNHHVEMFPKKIDYNPGIIIYHYPVRGYEHFEKKVRQGGESLEKNPSKNIGTHWRALYDIYKEGNLEKEYKKIVGGNNLITNLLKENIIIIDNTVPNILKNKSEI